MPNNRILLQFLRSFTYVTSDYLISPPVYYGIHRYSQIPCILDILRLGDRTDLITLI